MDIVDFDNPSSETIGLLILEELKMMRQDVVASLLRMEEQINNLSSKQSKTQKQKSLQTKNRLTSNNIQSLAMVNDDEAINATTSFNVNREHDIRQLNNGDLENMIMICKEEVGENVETTLSASPMPILKKDANHCPSASNNYPIEASRNGSQIDKCVKDLTNNNQNHQEEHDISIENYKNRHNINNLEKLSDNKKCIKEFVFENQSGHLSNESFKVSQTNESCNQEMLLALDANLDDNGPPSFVKRHRKHEQIFEFPLDPVIHLNRSVAYVGDKKFVCQVCQKRFSRPGQLVKHMNIHSKDNEKYSGYKQLKNSIKPHSGDFKCQLKNNVCSYCFKTFSSSGNLQRHIRSHTNDRRYQCTICLKRFFRNCHLKEHLNTHS